MNDKLYCIYSHFPSLFIGTKNIKHMFSTTYRAHIYIFIALLGFTPFIHGQTVEVQGKLKLDTNFVSQANGASEVLVLDGDNNVAKKNAGMLGVPATGYVLSEEETNILLINAGFSRKGKFVIPFERDSALTGGGSHAAISNVNSSPASPGILAVWTGTIMIVWDCNLNAGGRYNPTTDTWASMSAVGSPSARNNYSTVWTGTEMIAWGGTNGSQVLNTGKRYNPTTDTWTSMSSINAPEKYDHTAIWTGNEMIVCGGISSLTPFAFSNGNSRYNPILDVWTSLSSTNAPGPTVYHSAIWTGQEMIVHGGINNNTTKKYDPISDTWTNLAFSGGVRFLHRAIWTGSKMMIWGGTNSTASPIIGLNTGHIYDLASNTWTSITLTNAPSPRVIHSAVWTGEEMIIWGGMNNDIVMNTGARYNPTIDTWITTTLVNAPSPRGSHSSIWTGTEQIIWGGGDNIINFNDGTKYNPITLGYMAPINKNMYFYYKN